MEWGCRCCCWFRGATLVCARKGQGDSSSN